MGEDAAIAKGDRSGTHCIQEELNIVFSRFETLVGADIKAMIARYLPHYGITITPSPSCVLLSASLFSSAGSAIIPAIFMVLIHLAMTLHDMARQIDGRDRQLVILEGDHLYSCCFLLLCQTNCLHLLEKFSWLLRELNEGSVMRCFYEQSGLSKNDDSLLEILSKQYGLFFAECCELGGVFAGSQRGEILILRRFGHDFGIAYGLKDAGLGKGIYAPFLERALGYLDNLQSVSGKNELCEFARGLFVSSAANRFRMAETGSKALGI